MVINGMKYTILLGDPVFRGTENGVDVPIFDTQVFKESEEEFKRKLGSQVRMDLDYNFGEGVIDYKDSDLQIVRDGEGHYKYALISFIAKDIVADDLFKAVNPNNLYAPFNSANNLFLFFLGEDYEDAARSEFGLNGYAKISDIFVRNTEIGKELGFHGLFAPMKEFSQAYVGIDMYDCIIMDWGNKAENMKKCIWPGFGYGMAIIMDDLFIQLNMNYIGKEGIFLDETTYHSYKIADYRRIVGTADRLRVYSYLSPGRSFYSITPDIYTKQPVFTSQQATISGSGSTMMTFTIESSHPKAEIEESIKSDEFINGIANYFSTLSYQNLTWALEDEGIPVKLRDEVLTWYAKNAEYLSSVTAKDFVVDSYKIKVDGLKNIVTLKIKADIAFSDMPDVLLETAGINTGAVGWMAFILGLAKVVGAVAIVWMITNCKWVEKIIDVVVEMVKSTPEGLKWIWPLAIGIGAGWAGYLLFKRIFKKRR